MRRWIVTAVAVLGSLVPSVCAQDEAPGEAMSVSMGMDMPSQYFFRGIVFENAGFILQPWFELGTNLVRADQESQIGDVDMAIGLWNSLHEGPTGTGGGAQIWYESDFYVGLSTTFAEAFGVGATYTAYHSPNGNFATVQELAFSVNYDDASLWGGEFGGLQPSTTLAIELDNTMLGTGKGVYLEFAVSPGVTVSEEWGIQASFPVTLGLGFDDYFQGQTPGDDDVFGFLDIGVDFGMPIPTDWIPARFGSWSLSAGLHALFLGDTTEAANNNGDFEVIGTIGLSTGF